MIVPWVSVITYFMTPLHNIKLVIEYFYFIALRWNIYQRINLDPKTPSCEQIFMRDNRFETIEELQGVQKTKYLRTNILQVFKYFHFFIFLKLAYSTCFYLFWMFYFPLMKIKWNNFARIVCMLLLLISDLKFLNERSHEINCWQQIKK